MNKLILSDCDGVLLDWNTTFCEWASDRGYEHTFDQSYDVHLWYNILPQEAKELIIKFNESAAMCQLAPFRDSVFWVKRIHEEFGYKFRVITSMSTCPYAIKAREFNLKMHFGDAIENLVSLETGGDKDLALSKFTGSGRFWIEDLPKNAMLGMNMGLRSIVMEHNHNTDKHEELSYYNIPVVKKWKDIYKIIKKEYGNDS